MKNHIVRIASYNVRKARGLDQKHRPDRTLRVINELAADIVVLQEADKRFGERRPALPRNMIDKETDFQVVEAAKNGVSLGWHGNAILVRKELSVSDVRQIDLPGLEPRGAVALRVGVGKGLDVYATHLGLLRRDRRAQLDVLSSEADGRDHTVIAGDFNEWTQKKGLEALDENFDIHAPGLSFHASRPVAALDRIAMSRDIELYSMGVEQGPLARRTSDHLPVWADVVVPSETATC